MTQGIGGSTAAAQLAELTSMPAGKCITPDEYRSRLEASQALMRQHDIAVTYVNAGSNLLYFTGTTWPVSERMVGALIPSRGPLQYIAPVFERGTLEDHMGVKAEVRCWQEHESPYALLSNMLTDLGIAAGTIAIDGSSAFSLFDGIRRACGSLNYIDAGIVTQGCRMTKSEREIELLQLAKNMTLEVHKAAAKTLEAGITTSEVTSFINEAHKRTGALEGSSFCIVLFGEATAYPHGVKHPQTLKEGDTVLIDTGCRLHGYHSDITRSYVFGKPSPRQRQVWDIEKEAQAAAFEAAQPGRPCSSVDAAARTVLERHGFGPGYQLPGLPHRTGHGIGLDIHEGPYLVKSDHTPLQPGMCFSNEPMVCIPGEFGIRHEDHFYMTDTGPRWFTTPARSIDDPFG